MTTLQRQDAEWMRKMFDDPIVKDAEEDILSMAEDISAAEFLKDEIDSAFLRRLFRLHKLFRYNKRTHQLLTELNDRLIAVQTELYERTRKTYEDVKDRTELGKLDKVRGYCFLDWQYPRKNPLRTNRAKRIWDILTRPSVHDNMYLDGIGTTLCFDAGFYGDSMRLVDYLYLGDEKGLDNWNEGLNRKWSDDMHLCYAFHNLFDHMKFSVQDLFFVTDFETKIEVTYVAED